MASEVSLCVTLSNRGTLSGGMMNVRSRTLDVSWRKVCCPGSWRPIAAFQARSQWDVFSFQPPHFPPLPHALPSANPNTWTLHMEYFFLFHRKQVELILFILRKDMICKPFCRSYMQQKKEHVNSANFPLQVPLYFESMLAGHFVSTGESRATYLLTGPNEMRLWAKISPREIKCHMKVWCEPLLSKLRNLMTQECLGRNPKFSRNENINRNIWTLLGVVFDKKIKG